jgi:hypothetical protein
MLLQTILRQTHATANHSTTNHYTSNHSTANPCYRKPFYSKPLYLKPFYCKTILLQTILLQTHSTANLCYCKHMLLQTILLQTHATATQSIGNDEGLAQCRCHALTHFTLATLMLYQWLATLMMYQWLATFFADAPMRCFRGLKDPFPLCNAHYPCRISECLVVHHAGYLSALQYITQDIWVP